MQYATAKIGAILVNINPAYRTHELAYVLKQSGVRTLISATAFKTSDYVDMVDEVRPESPELRDVVFLGTDDWAGLRDRAVLVSADELRARQATLANTDPINIQYTSGTTGFPKGATLSHRNILNNGFFVTELINLGPADRLCIPVPFYHCFGMVMGNLGCTTHGATMVIPAPGFDPGVDAGRDRERTVHRCVRRADDVHRDARPPGLRRTRPVVAAHRHHGRSGVPGRGDEALRQRDEHDRGGHRLRHDRDVAGLVSDAHRRRPGAAHRLDRAGASACRDQDRRSRNRRPPWSEGSQASSARAATR